MDGTGKHEYRVFDTEEEAEELEKELRLLKDRTIYVWEL